MLSAAELDFATRETGDLPAWLKETAFRIWPWAAAKTLTLRLHGQTVLVKLRERSSILVGEISGFEPNTAAPGGVHVGDLIVFRPAHIFAVRD